MAPDPSTIAKPDQPLDVDQSPEDFAIVLAHVMYFGRDATPVVLDRLGLGALRWEAAFGMWFGRIQEQLMAGEMTLAKRLAPTLSRTRKGLVAGALRGSPETVGGRETPPASASEVVAELEPKPPRPALSVLEASNAAASKAARAVPPALPLEQYASLTATLEVLPAKRVSILERYGLTEAALEALRARWEIEFEHDLPLRDRFREKRDEVGARLAQGAAPAPAPADPVDVDATAMLSPSDLLKLKAALPFGRTPSVSPSPSAPLRPEQPAEHPMDTGTIEAPSPLWKPATPFKKPDVDDLDGTIEMQTPLRKKP